MAGNIYFGADGGKGNGLSAVNRNGRVKLHIRKRQNGNRTGETVGNVSLICNHHKIAWRMTHLRQSQNGKISGKLDDRTVEPTLKRVYVCTVRDHIINLPVRGIGLEHLARGRELIDVLAGLIRSVQIVPQSGQTVDGRIG